MRASLVLDIRAGLRALRSSPHFSIVTVLTLALGIGASVAMFGVIHSALVRALPFPNPDELVVGRATIRGRLNPWVAGADFYDYRNRSSAFRELAALLPFPIEMTESGLGEAHRVSATVSSPNLLPALGVSPALGRGFDEDEGRAGAPDVALVSHAYWVTHMGSDPAVVGNTLKLDGDPFTILGVLPKDFFFMSPADVWIPMRPDRYTADSRNNHNWYLVGRLRSDRSLAQAQTEVDAVSLRLQASYPESNAEKALLLTGLHEVLTEDYRLSLWLLSGAVILILLIACGNGAGILLARAPSRRFELSVRAALGASKRQLIRQLLSESLLVALSAGIIGTILAFWIQGIMLRYLSMDRLGLSDPEVSPVMLLAALGLSLFSGLLAGVYPALRTAHVSVSEGLKTGSRGGGGGGSKFRSSLVITQVALSIILLVASGLLIRSLTNLRALDPGFDAAGVLTAEVEIPATRYPDPEDRYRFFAGFLEGVQGAPGLRAAALTSHLPIRDIGNVYRASTPGGADEPVRIHLRSVFPGYFEALGIPLLSGRDVDDVEEVGSPWVVILSQTAAQRLFPDGSPLGRIVELPFTPGPRLAEVVGIVGDVRLSRLEEEPEAAVYVPYAHHARARMRLAVRTSLPPASLTRPLKEILGRMDEEVPLSPVAFLGDEVAQSMAKRRVITLSLTLLAALPLILASVGLFAVLAYHVSRRRYEMGIRMALGAKAGHVSGMILMQGFRMVGVGIVLGLVGAISFTRVLQSLLFGVSARDPATFLGVGILVLGVASVACAVPVWRATGADPRVVLEAE